MFWFLVLLLSCVYFLSFSINNRARLLLKHLPTFRQLPFLGSIHQIIGGGENAWQKLKEISEIIEEKSLPFVVWLAHHPVIIFSDPGEAKVLGNTFVEKPHYYNFGKIWLGNGLVTASGKIWKRNIKKIGGTFTRTIVNSYLEVFNLQALRLVEELRKEVNRSPFDARHYIAYRTLETICQTGLGVTNITDNIATVEYYNAFNRALKLITRRGMNFFYHSDWIYHLTPMYKDLKKQISVIHNVSDVVLKKRIQERKAIKKQKKSTLSEDKSTFKSLLDILLDLSETDPSLTEFQIRSEVDTVIVGGQETVATALFFAFLMIGCHPDVEKKLYAEIKEVLGDRRNVSTENLDRLVYAEAILYETLRMFPPIPVVMRYAHRDLKLGSCTVPRGATVLLNAWGAGRSERSWGNEASYFSPERWLPFKEPSLAMILAFSVGRRSCIGKSYAMAILKTMLVHCVSEFTFQSDAHNMKLKVDVALRPVSGHHLRVKLRSEKNLQNLRY